MATGDTHLQKYPTGIDPAALGETERQVPAGEAPPLAVSVVDPLRIEQHGDVVVGIHTVDLIVRGLAEIQAAVRRGHGAFRAA